MSGHHHHAHGEAHPHERASAERGLAVALALQAALLGIEGVGGVVTGSLSLLSDAGHVLTDVLALALSLWALKLAKRPAAGRHTFGYRRAEILAAFVNGLSLVVISLLICREAYLRYASPGTIQVAPMLAVALLGLVGNLAGMFWLARAHRSPNVRSALLHLLGDTLSSVGVVIGAIVIWLTGLTLVDVFVSVLVAGIILLGAINLLREVTEILLETAPPGLDTALVIAAMQEVAGVRQVHEFHLWRITHALPALSAHVDVDPSVDRDELLGQLQALLANRFDIRHTTLQLEVERLVAGPRRSSSKVSSHQ